MKPDVIVTSGTNPLAAVYRQTRTIPIVFVQAIDPVGGGYIVSLARPEGNVTGFSNFEYRIAAKWLELLTQIAPGVKRVGVIYEPTSPQAAALSHEIEGGAKSFGLQTVPLPVRDLAEIERSVAEFAQQPDGGLIPLSSPFTVGHRDVIIGLAARHRLPSVYPFRYFAMNGGLASYGIDNHDLYKRAASYIDRILKGEKPGDLPVQQATKFELVINLKVAKALGLDVPMSLLARTDEVIE
jgi:putative ABC transport system substrate-binding protein